MAARANRGRMAGLFGAARNARPTDWNSYGGCVHTTPTRESVGLMMSGGTDFGWCCTGWNVEGASGGGFVLRVSSFERGWRRCKGLMSSYGMALGVAGEMEMKRVS